MTHISTRTLHDLRNVTQEEFMFSDFDQDKVANIDDTKPFDKRYGYRQQIKGSGYSAPVLWGSAETPLSEELKMIMKYNKSRRPQLRRFLRQNPHAYGRVKSVSSTIKKFRVRQLEKGHVGDIVAATYLTHDRKSATKAEKRFKRKYPTSRKAFDDYYKRPLQGAHYAYHIGIKNKRKSEQYPHLLELQVKSHRMSEHDTLMHPHYKLLGHPTPEDKRRGRELYKAGY